MPSERSQLLGRSGKKKWAQKIKPLRVSLAALLLLLVVGSVSINYFQGGIRRESKKKNVIFFVTDGMGPASLSLTRSFRQFRDSLDIDDILNLDKRLIGSSRTRSSNSLITDSAAGATAFSCALKSYNGAIGVNPTKDPCGTLLEAAKLNGLLTGLVVTTRITDATPAAFSSHVDYRFQEDLIAEQQLGGYPLGRMVDLMIGGGRTHFYTAADSEYGSAGSRADGRNLIKEAKKNGWSYVGNIHEFHKLQQGANVSLPLLALLADYDIPFDIDRDEAIYPSLEEEAMTAVNALSKATENSDKGFFLMIEGSRIDHAGHQNDAAAQVREVLAFDKAFEAVRKFAEQSDDETILIVTSDHETGGLVTAKQLGKDYPEYVWYPQALLNASHSGEYLSKKVLSYTGENKEEFIETSIFERDLGIVDYKRDDVKVLAELTSLGDIADKLNLMVSDRARVGWTTHGHSAVDVNIYAYANRQSVWHQVLDNLQGNHENIEIGQFMADYLDFNLTKVTELVKKTKHSPADHKIELLDNIAHHSGLLNDL
ncbi:LAMI_0E12332g1_1 [Lachancea mirantina]|uniref:Alkaline phosphatase n=1 Tax=Lachancea mirantina TaxID=1230905 RepID=A0A1G4JQ22_9SACH|nr:LAMI_0E12332g1_1 [Lachancea mirantina]